MIPPPAKMANKGAAGIITVIVLGAAYVAYSMYVQFDEYSNNQLTTNSTTFTEQAKPYQKVEADPFLAALLAPEPPVMVAGYSDDFIQALQKKFGSLNLAPPLSPDLFPDAQAAKYFKDLEAAYRGDDFDLAQKTVDAAIAYCTQKQIIQKTQLMDIYLLAIKIANKARKFDQARLYVDQARAISRKNQDYRMDTFEALSCLLSGNLAQAKQYQLLLERYNNLLVEDKKNELGEVATALVTDTETLPVDSFYRLNAGVAKAAALQLAKKKQNEEGLSLLQSVEGLAKKNGDLRLTTVCEGLTTIFGSAAR